MNKPENDPVDPSERAPGNVHFRNEHPTEGNSTAELIEGLTSPQKFISPKYFYDQRGSQLFDEITRLPEYYPTRTEMGILTEHSAEISEACGQGCLFIEPGSGSCEKVRLLLDALRPQAYVPVDISADFLLQAATKLGREYPWLTIKAICADFNDSWSFVEDLPLGKRVIFYPGSTIGNLDPANALAFLKRIRAVMGEDGGVLIGADLHKASSVLNAAYNDAQNVTAEFNLNVLNNVNAILNSDFDTSQFTHRAFYNLERRRIEMHLLSKRTQTVHYASGAIELQAGESIHTENSYKYTTAGFAELAESAGLRVSQSWIDKEQLFSVHYLRAA
ncbi:MAG: L-histidine N(alpha)-methyltransferase [Pseudomonadota bacterium]